MAKLCKQICTLLNEGVVELLQKRRINTVAEFLQEDPEKLVFITKLSYKDILQIRNKIIGYLAAFPHKGINMYNDLVTNMALITTGIGSLDNMLGGGFMTGSLYELWGFSGSGKTQLCLSTASNVAYHLKKQVHYVDAKFDFSGKRVLAMLESRGLNEEDIDETFQKIKVTRIRNIFELFSFLYSLKEHLPHEQDGRCAIRLIIIDSLPTIFFPFLGEAHNDGISYMSHLASIMKYIALEYHIAFLLVNFATRWIGDESCKSRVEEEDEEASNNSENSEIIKPALGKYWVHIPSTRLFLSKSDCNINITVTKSTCIKLGLSCKVVITNKGVE